MPQARSASAAPRYRDRQAQRARTGPRRVVQRRPAARIRWDRVGRVGLLIVLAVVVGLYVQHTLSYFSTRAEADRKAAVVLRLTRENAALLKQQHALRDPATIQRDARALGMVQAGERSYVVPGLPKH